MQFFVHEIVARLFAAYVFCEGSRILWHGLTQRRISLVSYDFVDILLNMPDWIAHRDSMPVRYWFAISGQVFLLMACLIIMVFGWYVPKG